MSFDYPKAHLEYKSSWPSLLIQTMFLVWCIPCIDFLLQIPGLCREDNRSCGSVLATGFSCSFSESYQLPEYWLHAARIEEVCFHRCPGEDAAMSSCWQSIVLQHFILSKGQVSTYRRKWTTVLLMIYKWEQFFTHAGENKIHVYFANLFVLEKKNPNLQERSYLSIA